MCRPRHENVRCWVHPESAARPKNTGFRIQYGGGANHVARMTHLSHRAAEKMIQKFFGTYPRLQKFIRQVSENSEIVLPSGRRAAVDSNRRYVNLNYFVQGTLAVESFGHRAR